MAPRVTRRSMTGLAVGGLIAVGGLGGAVFRAARPSVASARPFYGEAAADELTTLLEEHITGAAALLTAAKSGDQTAVEIAGANWYANADAIAAFLATANPEQWPRADLEAEMRMHLDLTLEEATARLNRDFAADIAAYDVVHDHILGFADRLSDGIVAQFPDQFA